MSNIHTVIFDLDGTLSNTSVITMAALEHIAPNYGFPVPSVESVKRTTGYANPEFYYILFPGFDRETVYNMGMDVEIEENRLLPSIGEKLLFEGCRELLERLKEPGIRICIASTGDRDHVYPILNETQIIGFFDSVSCGRSDKIEMLREMTEYNDKNGYIMVGDMKKDYEAARMNGILSVGACYGYCRRELSDFDLYIDEPLHLLRILVNTKEKDNASYNNR